MDAADLARLRQEYAEEPFSPADLAADPVTQFRRWLDEVAARPDLFPEPNAMVFATASTDGQPSARTVLLKAFDERGFVLFTNYASRKGREALANPQGSLAFPWYPIQRQVTVVGRIEKVSAEESAAYFAQRPRQAQIGAWASEQSAVIADRSVVEERVAALEQRFADGPVPVPEFWGGLRIVPETVEFWHGRPNRLHDRLRYRRDGEIWAIDRLSP